MPEPIMIPGAPDRGLNMLKGGLILMGTFLMMFFFTVLAQSAVNAVATPGTRTSLLICSALQSIMLFGVPALLWSALTSGSGFVSTLRLDRPFTLRALAGGVAIFIVAIPALEIIIEANAGMKLPWQEIENLFRTWEKTAEEQTKILLDTSSIGGLATGILCIGIITGFCEELFFRGALQGLLTRGGLNHHAAIWTAAVIFSLAHFQFYGFVPRILLGAYFGYIFFWSKSIWLNSALHAFNNSVVVIAAWRTRCGEDLADNAISGFLEGNGHWPVAIISTVATALLLYFLRKWIFAPWRPKENISPDRHPID